MCFPNTPNMDSAANGQLNDQTIYQVTKDIFVGQKAKFRKLTPVRKSIDSHSKKSDMVRQYVTQHGAEVICQTVLRLLSERVYESTLVASQRFPDLFEPSVAQAAARDTLEAEAARSEEAALEDIAQAEWTDDGQVEFDWGEVMSVVKGTGNGVMNSKASSLSLFPVYLPFPKEHRLMRELQKTLELACYEFGTRALPDIMQKQGWDCPESVELNKWTELLKRGGVVKRDSTRKPLKELSYSVANIRHTAVHRLRTNSTGLERFLTDAEDLARALGSTTYADAISQLRSTAESALAELAQNKHFLQLRMEKTQEAIAKKRAELDLREQEAIDRMGKENEKYQMLAGERLDQALDRIGNFRAMTSCEKTALNGVTSIEDIADGSDDDMDEFEDCHD